MKVSQSILCLYLYLFTQAITVTAQSTYTRKSLTGSDVTLPCDYNESDDGNWFLVTWSVLIGGTFQNLYVRAPGSTDNSATPPAQFAGRVAIDGISNLRLTGVTIADEDQYRCLVTAQTSPTTLVNLQVFQQPSRPQVQVQYDPQPADTSRVPLSTTVTFTCTSTGGRPPATLTWAVIEGGTQVSVNPTYTSSNNSQGVGDATSTFNFTTTKYGVRYWVECVASGSESSPIQTQRSTTVSFTTEPDPSATPNTTVGQTDPISSTMATTPTGPTAEFETNCSGPGVLAGAAVGCFFAGLLVGGAAVFLFLHFRAAKNGGKKDVGNFADRHYENVPHPNQRLTSQRPGSGSEEYEVPMETIQPPTVQPPQSSDDYQELRPAVYQSLQR